MQVRRNTWVSQIFKNMILQAFTSFSTFLQFIVLQSFARFCNLTLARTRKCQNHGFSQDFAMGILLMVSRTLPRQPGQVWLWVGPLRPGNSNCCRYSLTLHFYSLALASESLGNITTVTVTSTCSLALPMIWKQPLGGTGNHDSACQLPMPVSPSSCQGFLLVTFGTVSALTCLKFS